MTSVTTGVGGSGAGVAAPSAPAAATGPEPGGAAGQAVPTEGLGVPGPLGRGFDRTSHVVGKGIGIATTVVDDTYGRFDHFVSGFARHAIDTVGGLGLPSLTWNAREAYRTRYTESERMGAASGDVVGALFPVVGGAIWLRAGAPVLGLQGAALGAARVALVGAALVAEGNGVRKVVTNAIDDGDVAAPVATVAAVATLVGVNRLVHNPWVDGAAALGVAAGTYLGLRQLPFSGGHIGADQHVQSISPRLDGPAGAPVSFARGFWNHFADEGPLTVGTGFAGSWRARDQYRHDYNDTEQYGGMAGDLAATVLVGTGAVAVGSRVLGHDPGPLLRSPLGRVSIGLSLPAHVIGRLKDVGRAREVFNLQGDKLVTEVAKEAEAGVLHVGTTDQEHALEIAARHAEKFTGKVPQMLWLAGLGLVGYTLYDAWDNGHARNAIASGPVLAGVTGAALLGGAVAMSKTALIQRLPAASRPAMALFSSAALVSSLFVVRGPMSSFVRDAVDIHDRHGVQLNAFSGGVIGTTGLVGALAGLKVASMVGTHGRFTGATIAAGALLGAAAGYAFVPALNHHDDPTTPDAVRQDRDPAYPPGADHPKGWKPAVASAPATSTKRGA